MENVVPHTLHEQGAKVGMAVRALSTPAKDKLQKWKKVWKKHTERCESFSLTHTNKNQKSPETEDLDKRIPRWYTIVWGMQATLHRPLFIFVPYMSFWDLSERMQNLLIQEEDDRLYSHLDDPIDDLEDIEDDNDYDYDE